MINALMVGNNSEGQVEFGDGEIQDLVESLISVKKVNETQFFSVIVKSPSLKRVGSLITKLYSK